MVTVTLNSSFKSRLEWDGEEDKANGSTTLPINNHRNGDEIHTYSNYNYSSGTLPTCIEVCLSCQSFQLDILAYEL